MQIVVAVMVNPSLVDADNCPTQPSKELSMTLHRPTNFL
jgi:hypothetical protein